MNNECQNYFDIWIDIRARFQCNQLESIGFPMEKYGLCMQNSFIYFFHVSYSRAPAKCSVYVCVCVFMNVILFYFLYWINKMFWLHSFAIRKSENEKRRETKPKRASELVRERERARKRGRLKVRAPCVRLHTVCRTSNESSKQGSSFSNHDLFCILYPFLSLSLFQRPISVFSSFAFFLFDSFVDWIGIQQDLVLWMFEFNICVFSMHQSHELKFAQSPMLDTYRPIDVMWCYWCSLPISHIILLISVFFKRQIQALV